MKSLLIKEKRGQQEIIVTVLLVLVALAAVGAIAYFVNSQIQKNVGLAKNKAACLDVSLSIEKVDAASIVISRGGDALTIDSLKLFVDGESSDEELIIPDALESKKTDFAIDEETGEIILQLTAGQKVRVNPVIGGYTCENGAEATVA